MRFLRVHLDVLDELLLALGGERSGAVRTGVLALDGIRHLSTSLGCSRRARGAAILDGHDANSRLVLEVLVDDQHPPPRPEQEPKPLPSALERRSHVRERRQRPQRALDAVSRVGRGDTFRSAALSPQRRLLSARRGPRLQIVERDRSSGLCLLPPSQCTLIRSRKTVEKICSVARIRVGLVESVREQRPRERPLLRVRPLREPRQLLRMFCVEGYVQAGGDAAACHCRTMARNGTKSEASPARFVGTDVSVLEDSAASRRSRRIAGSSSSTRSGCTPRPGHVDAHDAARHGTAVGPGRVRRVPRGIACGGRGVRERSSD